jgi:hypothetical protein
MKHSIFIVLPSLILATSCATYLNSGQLGYDSVVPLPLGANAEKSGSAMVFAKGSFAKGIEYPDDDNAFAQAGVLGSWRLPMESNLFDGHLALSGWYGHTILKDHGDSDSPQYPLAVGSPLAFFGGSAQAGGALGLRLTRGIVLDLGIRLGAAYEAGPYRDFRAKASRLSSDIVDCCPSGWSGSLASDTALQFTPIKDLDLRLGLCTGWQYTDLPEAFSGTDREPKDWPMLLSTQASLAVRYRKVYVAASLDSLYLMNAGFSMSLGYIFY